MITLLQAQLDFLIRIRPSNMSLLPTLFGSQLQKQDLATLKMESGWLVCIANPKLLHLIKLQMRVILENNAQQMASTNAWMINLDCCTTRRDFFMSLLHLNLTVRSLKNFNRIWTWNLLPSLKPPALLLELKLKPTVDPMYTNLRMLKWKISKLSLKQLLKIGIQEAHFTITRLVICLSLTLTKRNHTRNSWEWCTKPQQRSPLPWLRIQRKILFGLLDTIATKNQKQKLEIERISRRMWADIALLMDIMTATIKELLVDTTKEDRHIQDMYHSNLIKIWLELSTRSWQLITSKEPFQVKIWASIQTVVKTFSLLLTQPNWAKYHLPTWHLISGMMDTNTGTNHLVLLNSVTLTLKMLRLTTSHKWCGRLLRMLDLVWTASMWLLGIVLRHNQMMQSEHHNSLAIHASTKDIMNVIIPLHWKKSTNWETTMMLQPWSLTLELLENLISN